jgi:glycosidase
MAPRKWSTVAVLITLLLFYALPLPCFAEDIPATVATVPAAPMAGETVRVWYPAAGRPLSNSAQLNLHWGINTWTNIQDQSMIKDPSNAFYVDLVLPSNTTRLDFVFKDGAGTWDNNSTADWHVTVISGSGSPDTWYFRGTPNGWGITPMDYAGGDDYETTVTFSGQQNPARFKIDHYGDWSENYPTADYEVTDFRTYRILFNSNSKSISVTQTGVIDVTAPVVTASPVAGNYPDSQTITLGVSDDVDTLPPPVFYTTDGTAATSDSQIYTGQSFSADDLTTSGADLIIHTFTFDHAGNVRSQSFAYYIGASVSHDRGDFREESIYFLLTARFFDGDSSNNFRTSTDDSAGNAPDDPAWRGDFKGLVQKLDYIKALGFSAIWITPVVQNRSGYDYHGYHGYDFNKVDPRLESPGWDFQRVIDECHARGMKLVLDVVLNHSCNWGAKGLMESSNPDWTARLQDELFPSEFYHDWWLQNWEDYTCQIGSIAGDCADFNTEDSSVQQYLINAYDHFIDMGVDGFRIDTVKHVSRVTMNRRFIPAFKAEGGSDFFMFGEVATRVHEVWNKGVAPLSTPFYTWAERQTYSSDDATAALDGYNYEQQQGTANQPTSNNHYLNGNNYHAPDYSRASGLDVIDFPMHWNFGNAGSAFNIRSGDLYYNDATWNVTYVDSHDYGPDMDTRYSGSEAELAENWSLMFSFRGIPCVYYGSEIQFQKGAPCDCGPSCNIATTGRAYYGDHLAGNVTAADFGLTDNASGEVAATLSHPLARHLQRLNRIRRLIPALQKGQYSTDNISGAMAFKRRFTAGDVDSFALVTISGPATFYNIPDGIYQDAVTGNVISVTDGTLNATCSGQANMRVYVLNLPGNPAPGKIGADGTYLNASGTAISGVANWKSF